MARNSSRSAAPRQARREAEATTEATVAASSSSGAVLRPSPSKPAGPLLIGGWLSVLVLLLVGGPDAWAGAASLALGAIGLFFAGMLTLARVFPTKAWSPAAIYLLTFGVFHLGLTPYWIIDTMPPTLIRESDAAWFFGELGQRALYIVNVGVVSFVLAAVIVSALVRPTPATLVETAPPRIFTTTGSIALLVSITLWLYYSIQVGGVEFYQLPYLTYFELIGETPIPDLFLIIGFALCLVVISPERSSLRTSALIVFVAWAAVSFFMGTRGHVLFPLTAAATVIAWRRRMPRLVSSALILVAVLFLVDTAKQVRQLGIGSGISWAEASPLNGIAELGSTIRVVAYTAQWHDQGTDFAYGATYTVWPVRVFERLAGVSAPAPDVRMFNVLIQTQAGAIGGSAVGEAFHNFGLIGAVLIMMALGTTFAYFSVKGGSSPWRLAVYAAIAAPLFYQARNSFVPVIPLTLTFLTVVAIMYGVSKLPRASNHRRHLARLPGVATRR